LEIDGVLNFEILLTYINQSLCGERFSKIAGLQHFITEHQLDAAACFVMFYSS